MAKNKNKTVVEKIADAVDHVLHPGHESGPEMVEASESDEVKVEASENLAGDYAKHPKFDKFKSTQGEN